MTPIVGAALVWIFVTALLTLVLILAEMNITPYSVTVVIFNLVVAIVSFIYLLGAAASN